MRKQVAPRRDPRFCIEHCIFINAGLVGRMGAVGVILVPFSWYVYFHGEVMHFYGEERLKHM
jgi:predicted amidohydrolase YtcJ